LLTAAASSSKLAACSTCASAPTKARVAPPTVAVESRKATSMAPPLVASESAIAWLAATAFALTLPVAVIRAVEPK